MSFLLDTNVVSEIRKRAPNSGVATWFASVPADQLFLSVLVVGEIRQGIERLARRDRAQAEIFEGWLSQLVDGYGDRLVPITAPIAETWGRLNVPDPVPVVDGLMAATALVHDWTLVTRNVDDVRSTGVRLLDPFTEASRGIPHPPNKYPAPVNRAAGKRGADDRARLRYPDGRAGQPTDHRYHGR